MRKWVLGVLSFVLGLQVAYATDWQLEKAEEGVKVWVAETPGSQYKQFKGEVVIAAPIEQVKQVLEDVPHFPQWYHKMVEAKVVGQLPDGRSLRYSVTDLPWPVSDRDSVVAVQKKPLKNGGLKVIFEAKPNAYPHQPERIRMLKLNGVWQLLPLTQHQVQVTFRAAAEPGGSIPSWLANQMVVDVPFHTLLNLKRRLEPKSMTVLPSQNNEEQLLD